MKKWKVSKIIYYDERSKKWKGFLKIKSSEIDGLDYLSGEYVKILKFEKFFVGLSEIRSRTESITSEEIIKNGYEGYFEGNSEEDVEKMINETEVSLMETLKEYYNELLEKFNDRYKEVSYEFDLSK